MRYRDTLHTVRAGLGLGLRTQLRGYRRGDLRRDAVAGLTVGVVALPLSMALAIAVGLPPQHGLYTAIVAGAACALLGGAPFQVSGPTAAFVALLAPVATAHGLGGVLLTGLLAGAIQVAMGAIRLGHLMVFIPHPVTTGFTAGVAVVIATTQLGDLVGIAATAAEPTYLGRLGELWRARGGASWVEAAIALGTLAMLLGLPRLTRRAPASLVALAVASLAAAALVALVPGVEVATIGSRFATLVDGELVRGLPPLPPLPSLPWAAPGADGAAGGWDFALVRAVLPTAFGVAVLGAIESLLAATVADGLTGSRHDPDAELVAIGIGNLLCPFFGGLPATAALARTTTNVAAGARSPLAAVFHAAFVLACTVALAPLIGHLPMAALAALLLVVAKNMVDARHIAHLVRVAPRSDVLVLATCFVLTVAFDMVLAISVGVVLAALIFMRRMSDLTDIALVGDAARDYALPPGVQVYAIGGPMFFGAAQKAMAVLGAVDRQHGAVILLMDRVPVMDATGMVAFETLLARLERAGKKVILCGVAPQPRATLERAGIHPTAGVMAYAPDLETAASMAILHSARHRSGAIAAEPPPS